MPLQVRRGTRAELNAMTQPLAAGELVWVTNENKLYIGDGTTPSASLAAVSGYSTEDAQDAAAALLTSGIHSGITFTYGTTQDGANRIDAVVDPSAFTGIITATGFKGDVLASDDTVLVNSATKELFGTFRGDFKGSIFADDSSILVDGTNGVLRGFLLGSVIGDVKGSVFADDSSVIVDSVSSLINVDTIVSPSSILSIGSPENPAIPQIYSSDSAKVGDFFGTTDGTFVNTLNINISDGTFDTPVENSTALALQSGLKFKTYVNGTYTDQVFFITRNAINTNFLSVAPASDLVIQVNNNTEYNYLTVNHDGVVSATGGLQAPVYINGSTYTGELFTQLNGRPEPTPSITNGLTGTMIFDAGNNVYKAYTSDSDGAGTPGFTTLQGYNPVAKSYTQTTPSDTRPVQASFTASIAPDTAPGSTTGIMTVTAVSAGYIRTGMLVTDGGVNVAADTYILEDLTGGDWRVSVSQTVSSQTMNGPLVEPGTIIFVSDGSSGSKFQGWDGSSWVSLG